MFASSCISEHREVHRANIMSQFRTFIPLFTSRCPMASELQFPNLDLKQRISSQRVGLGRDRRKASSGEEGRLKTILRDSSLLGGVADDGVDCVLCQLTGDKGA